MAMLAIVFLLILFLTPMAESDVLGSFCGTNIVSDNNSATFSIYQANLNVLSAEITKNASSAEFLFAKGSVGSGGQTLYGLTLCFGETTASECRGCVGIAFKNLQQLCGFNNMDATVIDDMCVVRYSYADFIDSYDYQEITNGVINLRNTRAKISKTLLPGWDPGNSSRITRVMKKLLLDTSQTAAYNSKRRYLTGFMDATSTTPRLYSMAQCTPDMTPGDCMTCLQYISDVAMTSFAGQQAARVLSLRCSLRYDTAPFSSIASLWKIEPPADTTPAIANQLKHKSKQDIISFLSMA